MYKISETSLQQKYLKDVKMDNGKVIRHSGTVMEARGNQLDKFSQATCTQRTMFTAGN
jgi:hypothetical protein